VLIDSSEAEQNAPPPPREPTWLAQIAEINHEVEIELDDALAKLRETAREIGIATTRQEERAKTAPPLTNLNRDVEWKYDHIMEGYRSLSGGRHHALSVLAVSLAMSALNAGYNIEAGELQDLLAQAQRDNPPTNRYKEKELAHLAETSIPIAQARVGDDPAYKKKAEAEARWEAEEARIRREIGEMDAEGEALSSRLGGDAEGAMNSTPPYDDFDDEPEEDWHSANPKEGVAGAPQQQQTTQRKTRFRSRAESRDLPPPVYLIQDLIEVGADAVIYGDSESLKSFFALAMGGSLATGIPAFGKFEIPNQGVVFYFAAEGKNNMEKKRLTAWEVDNGFAPFTVEDVWIGDAAFMIDDKDVAECILDIECHLGDQKGKVPVLFVIDTLSRSLNGQDEDKANVAAKYLNNVKKIKDRIGGTSLTIAHTGKDRARGLRGSSGYFLGFDTVLAVDTNQDPDTLLHTSELTVEKQKDGITGIHYWFQSREVEIPTDKSLVLDPISDEDGKKDMTKKKPMNVNDVHSAIKSLAPNGSPLTKRQVATKVAAMMGITIDGAEKALDRNKDKDNDPYKVYRDGDKFHFPSSMQGADQTIADQIKELRDDETRQVRQSIQEQMDGIFPNGKSVN
jgi:AAA domain